MLDFYKNILEEARNGFKGNGTDAEALLLYAENVEYEITELRKVLKGKETLIREIMKLREKILREKLIGGAH